MSASQLSTVYGCEFSTMKCTITYFGDTEGELVPVGVWEVVVVVTEEEVGVILDDYPADELRARSIGCTVVAELWFRWFMCPINLKGEAKKKSDKRKKTEWKVHEHYGW
jgi:hypothetical protein